MEFTHRATARVVRTAATLLRRAGSDEAFRALCASDLDAALDAIGLADQEATYAYAVDDATGEQTLRAELAERAYRFTMSSDGDYRFESEEREAADTEMPDEELVAVAGGYATQSELDGALACCWGDTSKIKFCYTGNLGACSQGKDACRSQYFGGIAYPCI